MPASVLVIATVFAPFAGAQMAPLTDGRYVYLPDQTPDAELPGWLREIPAPDGLPGARRDFQIIPPRKGLDLAITISFDEPAAADNLLAYFRGARSGRMVAANLYQGTGLPNQRTIVLRNRLLDSPGVLSLSADGPELLIWRMEFQWMHARAVLIPVGSALEAPAAVLPDGRVLHYDELASGEDRPPREEWKEHIIRFPLVQQPERIETGVEYVFTLETLPRAAMLQMDLTGLPPGAQTRVMVNGKVGGWLQVALPSLAHGGYRTAENLGGGTELAGWRKAQAWIPASLLVTGENAVWLEFFERSEEALPEGETPAPGAGLQPALMFGVAARHLVLEMDYTPLPETQLAPESMSDLPAATATVPETPAETLVLDEHTSGTPPGNDELPDEQSATTPVSIKGEFRYDLMGDMAPALMLFMEDPPGSHPADPSVTPASAPAQP